MHPDVYALIAAERIAEYHAEADRQRRVGGGRRASWFYHFAPAMPLRRRFAVVAADDGVESRSAGYGCG
ncbi:MAG: hypothetical protein ABR593_11805 [Candidatus Limnocylindria bacterium]